MRIKIIAETTEITNISCNYGNLYNIRRYIIKEQFSSESIIKRYKDREY